MLTKLELDHGGIAELLKSGEFQALVSEAAQGIASQIEGEGHMVNNGTEPLPVVVDTHTTDRAAASVTLAHPAGLAVQAKNGSLTRAAAAQGLEVTERAG